MEVKVERHTGRQIGRADSCEDAGKSRLARSESGVQVLVLRRSATSLVATSYSRLDREHSCIT